MPQVFSIRICDLGEYELMKIEDKLYMGSENRDNSWIAGRIYFDRKDKRIIVKRTQSPFSCTMNFGNKWTWIINAIFIIIIIFIVVFVL